MYCFNCVLLALAVHTENTLGMEEVIELGGGYRGQKEKGSHDGL